MLLRLLPQNQLVNPDLVDYTHGVITRYYELSGSQYYFNLHPEQYPENDALTFTGRYMAVLLTPMGIRVFYLIKDKERKYEVDYTDDEVNQEDLKNGHGYITMYAQAIQTEVNEKMNFIKECLKMMNQAIAEFTP